MHTRVLYFFLFTLFLTSGYYPPLSSIFSEMPFVRPLVRQGTILVSPFISKQEQAVLSVLLKENLPFIYLADNGFRDYYKPSEALFDAVLLVVY